MAQTNLTVRLDENDKNNFADICDQIGLSVSAAINVFVKKVISECRIPFELSADPFYSEENVKRLLKAKKEVEAGNYEEHNLDEINELIAAHGKKGKKGEAK